ncbi:MAG: DMT family transporter [Lachnospiraceae bacterium]|nr:DMT family transporter [Lachnospiraceae bacterium]
MTDRGRAGAGGVLLLLLAALIWGIAFVAQSIGAEHVGPFTFLALRSWLGVFVLLPVVAVRAGKRQKQQVTRQDGSSKGERLRPLFVGGLCTGFFLFAASAAQQIGIASTTAGKSGFITAMYVILVPIVSVLLRRSPPRRIWVCVALSVLGLYLLCMAEGGRMGTGDLWTLLCALLFTFQILCISHYVKITDSVELTCVEFVFEALFATAVMLVLERGTAREAILAAMPAILYAGIFSSGVGYTLQTVGERRVSPPVASLAMCMESVFSALFGWLILGETLTMREFAGCALMFGSILLAEMPVESLFGKRRQL